MIGTAYHIRLVRLSLSKGLAAVYIGFGTTKAELVPRDTGSQEVQQLCCLLQAGRKGWEQKSPSSLLSWA